MTAKLKPSERNLLEFLHNKGPSDWDLLLTMVAEGLCSWPTVHRALRVLLKRGFIENADCFRITDAGRKALANRELK